MRGSGDGQFGGEELLKIRAGCDGVWIGAGREEVIVQSAVPVRDMTEYAL
jgi:hypothetical protein